MKEKRKMGGLKMEELDTRVRLGEEHERKLEATLCDQKLRYNTP